MPLKQWNVATSVIRRVNELVLVVRLAVQCSREIARASYVNAWLTPRPILLYSQTRIRSKFGWK